MPFDTKPGFRCRGESRPGLVVNTCAPCSTRAKVKENGYGFYSNANEVILVIWYVALALFYLHL